MSLSRITTEMFGHNTGERRLTWDGGTSTDARDGYTRVESCHPEARVLFMSRYTDDTIVRHGLLEPGTWLLHKTVYGAGAAAEHSRSAVAKRAAQNTPTG